MHYNVTSPYSRTGASKQPEYDLEVVLYKSQGLPCANDATFETLPKGFVLKP